MVDPTYVNIRANDETWSAAWKVRDDACKAYDKTLETINKNERATSTNPTEILIAANWKIFQTHIRELTARLKEAKWEALCDFEGTLETLDEQYQEDFQTIKNKYQPETGLRHTHPA